LHFISLLLQCNSILQVSFTSAVAVQLMHYKLSCFWLEVWMFHLQVIRVLVQFLVTRAAQNI